MTSIEESQKVLEAAGLVRGLALSEIHSRLASGLRLSDSGQRILAFYFGEMDAGRLYQATGHSSTAHYAEARLGLDRRRTSELLAVGKKLLTLPAIDAAFCKEEIGWVKVLLLVPVVTPEHEDAWLARARESTCRDLALETRLARPGSPPPSPGNRKGLAEIRFPFEAQLSALTFQMIDLAKKKLSEECGRTLSDAECLEAMGAMVLSTDADGNIEGRKRVSSSIYKIVLVPEKEGGSLTTATEAGPIPLPEAQSASLYCDGETVDAREDVGVKNDPAALDPKTPGWLRHHVLARDHFRCRNCGSRHNLMVHHVKYREDHGPTCASNLVAVCGRCHGLVHAGLLKIVGEDAADVRFLDAKDRPVEEAAPPSDPALVLPRDVPATVPPAPLVTLRTLPAAIDGAWWRAHGHLVRFGTGGLEFHDGMALAPEAIPPSPQPVAPVPFAEAFQGIVGQDALLARLRTAATARGIRGKAFPHALFSGPAGTGKTTLAHRLAFHLGSRFVKTSGPLLQDVHQLLRVLADLREKDVLFLDEAHRVPPEALEALYEALDARSLSLLLHQGASVRAVRFDLPRFTLVAATSEEHTLSDAFKSRFGIRETLGWYDPEDLARLLETATTTQGFTMDEDALWSLARAARGTPREGLRLLERAFDHAAAAGTVRVGAEVMAQALAALGYDKEGLRRLERDYLALLRDSPAPVSLARLAATLGMHPSTLLRDVEPHLFRVGLVRTTPRGRVAVDPPRRSRTDLSERSDKPGLSERSDKSASRRGPRTPASRSQVA